MHAIDGVEGRVERAEASRIALGDGSNYRPEALPPHLPPHPPRHPLPQVLDANTELFRQGSTGNNFYILVEGKLDILACEADGKSSRIASLSPVSFLGEIALLYACPRTCSVQSRESACALLSLSKEHFNGLLGDQPCAEPSAEPTAPSRARPCDVTPHARGLSSATRVVTARHSRHSCHCCHVSTTCPPRVRHVRHCRYYRYRELRRQIESEQRARMVATFLVYSGLTSADKLSIDLCAEMAQWLSVREVGAGTEVLKAGESPPGYMMVFQGELTSTGIDGIEGDQVRSCRYCRYYRYIDGIEGDQVCSHTP